VQLAAATAPGEVATTPVQSVSAATVPAALAVENSRASLRRAQCVCAVVLRHYFYATCTVCACCVVCIGVNAREGFDPVHVIRLRCELSLKLLLFCFVR